MNNKDDDYVFSDLPDEPQEQAPIEIPGLPEAGPVLNQRRVPWSHTPEAIAAFKKSKAGMDLIVTKTSKLFGVSNFYTFDRYQMAHFLSFDDALLHALNMSPSFSPSIWACNVETGPLARPFADQIAEDKWTRIL